MTLNCKGQLIDLKVPKIMGILNVTPDSFYDGGKYKDEHALLAQVEKMLKEGATFVDIGAYSSRPGAKAISEEEELNRILPVTQVILKQFPEAFISIDSFRSSVADACIAEGAAMINDISGGHLDKEMLSTAAKHQVPYIMMHMRGTPQTMQNFTQYESITRELLLYFSERLSKARELKLNDLIIDPGFGFSKTLKQNFELLNQLELVTNLEAPLLVGISRKSMIYKTLNTSPQEALNGTTALNMVALNKGANILRVHDVAEAAECILLHEQLK